jgi:hypothetical protein
VTEFFATPDDTGDLRASELHSSLGEELGAEASQAFMGGTRTLMRGAQYAGAASGLDPSFGAVAALGGPAPPTEAMRDTTPDVAIGDAKARVKQEGLEPFVKLPDQDTIRGPVLDLMLQDASERAQYSAAVNRGPQGFMPGALGFMTQVGAGMIDPVNAAAFSIPVLGEARAGKLMASAGDSILGRAAVRTGIGAAQGAVGGAALLPADWWLHTQDGQDYTMADALKSVVLSAGMGAAFHAGFGGVGDLYSRIRGRPLVGAPAIAGTHLPEETLAPGGVDLEGVPGIGGAENNAPAAVPGPRHPAEVLADLPQRAQEDVVHASIADVINGEPGRAGELLQEASKEDPRIAESFDAYHGTPYDFDAFDNSKIGRGEGAQVYGHGLYFAENEDVADEYRRNVVDKGFLDQVNARLTELSREMSKLESGGRYRKFTDQARGDELAAEYDRLLQERADGTKGTIYKVRVAADQDHFLDWDKPLGEQSEHVKRALNGLMTDDMVTEQEAMIWQQMHPTDEWAATSPENKRRMVDEFLLENPNFKPAASTAHVGVLLNQLARHFGGEGSAGFAESENKRASDELQKRGIPGVKYLDQGSRPSDAASLERSITAVQKQIAGTEEHVALNRDNPSLLPAFFKRHASDLADLRATLERYRTRLAELGKPTRNYVVFDDKLIRITHKNGKEVGLDELRPPKPEAAPGPAPGSLRTGRPNVDAVLAEPVVADAIANGPVNRANDVPYEAGASKGNDPTTNLDSHLPRQVELKSGTFDPAIPAKIHEQVEKFVMERLLAKKRAEVGRELKQSEIDEIYEIAHHEYAEPAEDAWYRQQGLDIDEVNAWWAKQDKITEHENPKNPPPNLYTKPYPHNEVEGVKHEEKGAAAEWPTKVSAEGAGGKVVPLKPKAKAPQSLLEFLAAKGGVSDKDPLVNDLLQHFGGKNPTVRGRGKLVREGGWSLDRAREAAVEAGYIHDTAEESGGVTQSSIDDLLDAVGAEAGGEKQYPRGEEGFQSKAELEAANEQALAQRQSHDASVDAELEQLLTDRAVPSTLRRFVKRRALDLMAEHDSDPETALDRAIDEFESSAPKPGADWQSLARRSPDDDELVTASNEAEQTPAPADTPEKAVTAAEAAAAEADKLLEDLLPKLTEDERKAFEETLTNLENDKTAREQIVRDGAACLAAASVEAAA